VLLLRRIDCVLAPTKKNVLKKYDELKDEIENLDLVLFTIPQNTISGASWTIRPTSRRT